MAAQRLTVWSLLALAPLALGALHCGGSDEPDRWSSPLPAMENIPGLLKVTAPARGAFVEESNEPLVVEGTGASPALTINGEPAEVSETGKVRAVITPKPGLNIIVAADGESRLESGFLYGHFVKASESVSQGIAVNLGVKGINGAAPLASLNTVTNMYLKDRDLISGVKGQSISGNGPAGVKMTYRINSARHGAVSVTLSPRDGGLRVVVVANNVNISGPATADPPIGPKVTRTATVTASRATVTGDANLSVVNGEIRADVPSASVKLDGFNVDIDGLPGFIDGIISDRVRPEVEKGMRDAVRTEVPKALRLTLAGLGMPTELDLSVAGFTQPLPIATRFDEVDFKKDGGAIASAVRFGPAEYNAAQPGSRAPGWLEISKPAPTKRADVMAASVTLDALNQFLFAVWGNGSLRRAVPDAAPASELKIDPFLPPLVTTGEAGGSVTFNLGEVEIQGKLSGNPFKAVANLLQEAVPEMDGDALTLRPQGDATLSITWLEAETITEPLRKIVVALAKDQLATFLKSLRIPVPVVSLDGLGGAFKGQSLAIGEPAIDVDPAARIDIAGAMKLVR